MSPCVSECAASVTLSRCCVVDVVVSWCWYLWPRGLELGQANSGTVAEVQRLLGVAKDDVQQCIENMEKRLETMVKAAADRGPHKYAILRSVSFLMCSCEMSAPVGACGVRV